MQQVDPPLDPISCDNVVSQVALDFVSMPMPMVVAKTLDVVDTRKSASESSSHSRSSKWSSNRKQVRPHSSKSLDSYSDFLDSDVSRCSSHSKFGSSLSEYLDELLEVAIPKGPWFSKNAIEYWMQERDKEIMTSEERDAVYLLMTMMAWKATHSNWQREAAMIQDKEMAEINRRECGLDSCW